MEFWMEENEKRLRAAAEHKGVSVFADLSVRDALRLAVGVSTTLGVLRARRQRAKRMRRKRGYK